MDDSTETPRHASGDDLTLDIAPRHGAAVTPSDDTHSDRVAQGQVELIEGSGPEMTRETESLLRGRLRLAALVMFFGFLVFLPQHVFQGSSFARSGGVFLFFSHLSVTIVLGMVGILLCRRCGISLARLRWAELITFGVPAAFLVALQHITILRQSTELARIHDALIHGEVECNYAFLNLQAGMWLVLIFTYALFVPNTWRRAAVVIGVLAATPIAMVLMMMLRHEEVYEALPVGELTGFALSIVVAAVTGLFGVDTIGSLRRQAFEARQLGQYRLTRKIGAGGMGEVYLAEHQMLKRACAIKLIRPGKAGDPKVLARFQREVRATAKLSHWNTVEIFDYGNTEDGTFYYVMEFLPGLSLRDVVDRFGPLPPERVIHLLSGVCDALEEAHAAGLIHRDIKPGNIFAAQRGGVYDVAKLLD
ncbi:MAG: serine/threonine protein kinase, partial [Candidatus Nealsonbacteria bacterium]|nr:serine/threonine protein kinase [Candidatus Nealsonbacteria bacterium]